MKILIVSRNSADEIFCEGKRGEKRGMNSSCGEAGMPLRKARLLSVAGACFSVLTDESRVSYATRQRKMGTRKMGTLSGRHVIYFF